MIAQAAVDIVQLIPEGVSVTAVVVVVVIMLRHNRQQKEDATEFYRAAQESFMGALDRISASHIRIEEQHAAMLGRVAEGLTRVEQALVDLKARRPGGRAAS